MLGALNRGGAGLQQEGVAVAARGLFRVKGAGCHVAAQWPVLLQENVGFLLQPL